jgi:hypothetical protein
VQTDPRCLAPGGPQSSGAHRQVAVWDIASAPLLGRYLADEDAVSEVLLQLFTAEIQFGQNGPFISIGTFELAVCDILYGEDPDRFSCLPTAFSREFKAMLVAWAKIGDIARFGPTDVRRYSSERSSWDRFEFETQMEFDVGSQDRTAAPAYASRHARRTTIAR